MTDFACVILLDARGRLLLQERDEHAPIAPEQWGLVGGHVEPGEDDEPAAYRELEEETGIGLDPGDLVHWGDFELPVGSSDGGEHGHFAIYVALTSLTDDDIVVGEGRRIVFVDPADLHRLDLARTPRTVLPAFLDAGIYVTMTR